MFGRVPDNENEEPQLRLRWSLQHVQGQGLPKKRQAAVQAHVGSFSAANCVASL